MEIERQFWVTDITAVPIDNAVAQHKIQQGYLAFEPELRIRQMDDAYFLTFKSSGGLGLIASSETYRERLCMKNLYRAM